MFYKEIPPPKALSRFIKCFWLMENHEKPEGLEKDKILPDGCMELIFHYGDLYREFKNDGWTIQPRSFVYGQLDRYLEVGPTGRTGIIAARFFPHGAMPFLNVPANTLADKATAIGEIFGQDGLDLESRIVSAESNAQRLALLQGFLVERFLAYEHSDHITNECVSLIVQWRGKIKVEELAAKFNMSSRHLERKFTSVVGMSPKMLARIVRFQNVFRLMQGGHLHSLTELAHEGGYYDQAHFIKDFKDFSGMSPTSYFSEKHLLGEHFTEKL